MADRDKLVRIVIGSITDAPEKYIVHQCNCLGIKAGGLAKVLFEQFPYANIYAPRDGKQVPLPGEEPGNIVVTGNGDDERYIINLMGQFYPGGTKDFSTKDTPTLREKWFCEALEKIKDIEDLESIAFPYQIGCGIAGGDWNHYKEFIKDFAVDVAEDGIEVVVYKLPDAA